MYHLFIVITIIRVLELCQHMWANKELDAAVYDFNYICYNHQSPHIFNRGLTPFEARYSIIISSLSYNLATIT